MWAGPVHGDAAWYIEVAGKNHTNLVLCCQNYHDAFCTAALWPIMILKVTWVPYFGIQSHWIFFFFFLIICV